MNRVGYHFRGTIVDQAREVVEEDGQSAHILVAHHLDVPEPIPETQEEINRQADAVLKDLFPRIPNIDRMEIIQHAFQKVRSFTPSCSTILTPIINMKNSQHRTANFTTKTKLAWLQI